MTALVMSVFLAANAPVNADAPNIDGKWLSHTAITNQSFSTTTTDCGDTLQELATAAEAGMVYVNVHTNDFPAGAIRGQLEKD